MCVRVRPRIALETEGRTPDQVKEVSRAPCWGGHVKFAVGVSSCQVPAAWKRGRRQGKPNSWSLLVLVASPTNVQWLHTMFYRGGLRGLLSQ